MPLRIYLELPYDLPCVFIFELQFDLPLRIYLELHIDLPLHLIVVDSVAALVPIALPSVLLEISMAVSKKSRFPFRYNWPFQLQ